MNHKRKSHCFCLALISTCLMGSHAMAAEEDTNDKILLNCVLKHRDTPVNANGSYNRAYVSGNTNSATGNVGDLRLYEPTSHGRTRFSMTWKGLSNSKNLWLITPDYSPKCMQGANGGVNARECTESWFVYLTVDDGYLVISDSANGVAAWKAPADSTGTGYLTSTSFYPDDPLSTRRRFHWKINDCTNLLGELKSPAP